jgi:hypothetical protein
MDTRDSLSGIKWQGMQLTARFCLLRMPGISATVLYFCLPQLCRAVSTAAIVPVPFGSGAVVVAILKMMWDLEKS